MPPNQTPESNEVPDMNVRLKPLGEQVVLITGASSGIGRQSAARFAEAGAKVVLVARNAEALAEAVDEIRRAGGHAIHAVADVADVGQFKAAAEAAVAEFGRIDTWVNNAGVGMYTKILDTDVADDRRLFETNFWGIVNGSRLGVRYLQAAGGGSLINVGSEVSDVAIPVQGMYATSKHAVRRFTDALREEILHDDIPVSVTLIKPAAINTPFPHHVKNNLGKDATLPAPVYAVDLVADQILHAAEHGGRELYAGGGGRVMAFLGRAFPTVMDHVMAATGFKQQLADRPPDNSNEGLHATRGFHQAEGDVDRDRHVKQVSLYNVARRHPVATTLVAAAVGAAAVGLLAAAEHDRDRR
jgi:short-subunit dehydrogenase